MNSLNKLNILHATGKKKTAVASVKLSSSKEHSFKINGKVALEYFQSQQILVDLSLMPFATAGIEIDRYSLVVDAHGGGHSSQAFAIRHAIAQIIAEFSSENRSIVKQAGLLTRDSRIVERKKPGLRKARRKEQFSKR